VTRPNSFASAATPRVSSAPGWRHRGHRAVPTSRTGRGGDAEAVEGRAVDRPAELRLDLLHGFELRSGGRAVGLPPSGQRVVAFLALHARPLARVFVAGSLWTDASEERAAAALRTALWRIGAPATEVVRSDGPTLALDRRVDVDLAIASRRAHEVLEGAAAAPRGADLALLCDAGDLLPDWYEDWVLIERERFRQLRLHALEALCRSLSAAGRHAEATEAGGAAVGCEPLRESAHRALAAAHLAEGNAGEALRQYDLCRGLLQRDLALAPSEAFEELVAPLRAR
jgi:DNA-binding SARP family transcriptional activator